MYAKHESSYNSTQLQDLSKGHHCKKNLQPQDKRKIIIYKVTSTTFQQSYQEKLHSSAYLKLHLSSDTLTTKIHLNSKIEEKNYLEKYVERKCPARHQLSRGNLNKNVTFENPSNSKRLNFCLNEK